MEMNWKVIFTGFGMDCTAYFNCAIDCDMFAQLMANDGRLIKVVVDGLDITDKYINTIVLN